MSNRPRKRETPLTRDEILCAALRLIDEEGLSALSMRRVGEDVGVEAMSLYHHVPNKDALLDGVVERMLREMRVPDPLPDDWRDIMETMLLEFRRILIEHPNVLPVLATRPPATPAAAPYMRVPLQILATVGLAPEDVVGLYQSLIAFAFGHSLLSAQFDGTGRPSEAAVGDLGEMMEQWDEATFRRSVRALMNGYSEHD